MHCHSMAIGFNISDNYHMALTDANWKAFLSEVDDMGGELVAVRSTAIRQFVSAIILPLYSLAVAGSACPVPSSRSRSTVHCDPGNTSSATAILGRFRQCSKHVHPVYSPRRRRRSSGT